MGIPGSSDKKKMVVDLTYILLSSSTLLLDFHNYTRVPCHDLR